MRRVLSLLLGLAVSASVVSAEELLEAGDFSLEPLGASGLNALNTERWGRFTSLEPMLLKVVKTPLGEEGKALRIESRGQAGAYQGFFQIVLIKPGNKYVVSAQVLNDRNALLQPGASGVLSVEWKDAWGGEVMREEEPAWDHELSSSAWTTARIVVTAPPKAVYGHFVVLQKDADNAESGGGGAFYISRLSVVEK